MYRLEREQLPHPEGLPGRPQYHPGRTTGTNMTRPHGGQFGRHVRTRGNDQWLDRRLDLAVRAGWAGERQGRPDPAASPLRLSADEEVLLSLHPPEGL